MVNLLLWLVAALVFMITATQGRSLIVEEGHPTSIQCAFPNPVTNFTWLLHQGSASVKLSTCIVEFENCTDLEEQDNYIAFVSKSGASKVFGLNITQVSKTSTEFTCLANTGVQVNVSLEVYVLPSIPYCTTNINDTYVEYSCRSVNAYPQLQAVLHRREENLTNSDFEPSQTGCHPYGDGSYQRGVECTWLIYIESMLMDSTMYATMSVLVSDMSAINASSVSSPDITTTLRIPEVKKKFDHCPEGTDVYEGSILIGTTATCPCEMAVDGVPKGLARWFTSDGRMVDDEHQTYAKSTLTLSYNSSNPTPSYECRPVTSLRANVTSVWFTASFTGDYKSAEIGGSTNLQCSFPSPVKSITWQLSHDNRTSIISTCTFANSSCTNTLPTFYRGSIVGSGSNAAGLTILNVRHNETLFSCLTDTELKTNITQLRVYVWPEKPTCRQEVKDRSIRYTCHTNNVYPELKAVLHRQGADFLKDDLSYNPVQYIDNANGVYIAYSTWDYHIIYRTHFMAIYVEMSAVIHNKTLESSHAPVYSDVLITQLGPPLVGLNETTCPVGPGVKGKTVKIGTAATCRCELLTPGSPPGYALWYTKDGEMIKDQTYYGGTATITFTYDPSDGIEASLYCLLRLGELVWRMCFAQRHILPLDPTVFFQRKDDVTTFGAEYERHEPNIRVQIKQSHGGKCYPCDLQAFIRLFCADYHHDDDAYACYYCWSCLFRELLLNTTRCLLSDLIVICLSRDKKNNLVGLETDSPIII